MKRYLVTSLAVFFGISAYAQEKIEIDKTHYDALISGLSESYKMYSNVLLREDKMDVELLSEYSSSFILYVSSLSVQYGKSRTVVNNMCENFEGFSKIQKSFEANVGLYSEDEVFIASRMIQTGQAVMAGAKVNCAELVKNEIDWGRKIREKLN